MSTKFGQLAFFHELKHQTRKHSSFSIPQQTTIAAFIAGFVGAVISVPFDSVKTQLQNQSQCGATKSLPLYAGMIDCFVPIVRKEGIFIFYRDFWPYFMRIAPHS